MTSSHDASSSPRSRQLLFEPDRPTSKVVSTSRYGRTRLVLPAVSERGHTEYERAGRRWKAALGGRALGQIAPGDVAGTRPIARERLHRRSLTIRSQSPARLQTQRLAIVSRATRRISIGTRAIRPSTRSTTCRRPTSRRCCVTRLTALPLAYPSFSHFSTAAVTTCLTTSSVGPVSCVSNPSALVLSPPSTAALSSLRT